MKLIPIKPKQIDLSDGTVYIDEDEIKKILFEKHDPPDYNPDEYCTD